MPEITNESPSDAELFQYLQACFPTVGADFTFLRIPDHLRSEQNRQREQACDLLPSLGFNEFWQQGARAVFASLQRLNQLPREDPVWYNSNLRPTLFKLWEFRARLFRDDPNNPIEHWTYAALHVFDGSRSFGEREWRALKELGHLESSGPVFAALFKELAGYPTAARLAQLLREVDLVEAAEPLLQRLRQCEETGISTWANRVPAQFSTE